MIDELALLRDLFDTDPPRPSDEVLDEVLARVIEGIEREAAGTVPPRAVPARPRRRRRVLATVGGVLGGSVLSAAAVIAIIALIGGAAATLPISKAAAATLRQDAGVVAAAPSVAPGKYLYVRSTVYELNLALSGKGGASTQAPQRDTEQIWVSASGTGRWAQTQLSPARLRTQVTDLGPGLTGDLILDPSGWPTTPAALGKAIVQRLEGGKSDTVTTFGYATQLAAETSDPKLVSACYRLMATLPGLADYATTRDSTGRLGAAVGMTVDGVRTTVILDRTTGLVLETTARLVKPSASHVYRGLAAGTLLYSQTFTLRRVVASVTATR